MATNNNTNMSTQTTSQTAQAKQSMNNLKYEIANEVGVNLKQGYNGDLTSRDAGTVGGNMVKHMIQSQEQKLSGTTTAQ